MKSNASKRIAAAVSGLALLGLSGLFNSAAHAWENTPGDTIRLAQNTAAVAPAPTLPAPVSAIDQKLIEQIDALGSLITKKYQDEQTYRAQDDAAVQTAIDAIIVTLKAGANGNLYSPPKGHDLLGSAQMSAFAAGTSIAIYAKRPDLVDEFVRAGASPKQIAPDSFSPMDYALLAFMQGQFEDRTVTENSFAVIQRLEAAGARTSEAKNVKLPGIDMALMIADYNGLAKTLMGRDVIEKAGGTLKVSVEETLRGPKAAREDLADEPRLTRSFVENNGAKLVQQNYSEAYPGGPEIYGAQPGDTLASIAARYYVVMGERSPLHGLSALMNLNDMDANAALDPGQRILIPKPESVQIVAFEVPEEMTVRDIVRARELTRSFYIPNASEDDVVRALARVNGVNEADAVADKFKFKVGAYFVMLHRNDSYSFLPKLTPPPYADPTRRVELAVIEGGIADPDTSHQKRTYGVATSANYAINPNVDFTRIYAWREHMMDWPPTPSQGMQDRSAALRAVLAGENNPLGERLIFSQSMEVSPGDPQGPVPKWQQIDGLMQQGTPESADVDAMRMGLEIIEKSQPVLFTAAGNQYANGEGPYKQSFTMVHAPHAYVIGAAGKYNTLVNGKEEAAYIMAPYSTGGADVCAPLPTFLEEQQEGTSFSTPLTAGLFRQESEWFGNKLSTEEMMAAAMMTARRNILDYNNPVIVGKSMFPAQFNTHVAKFVTNGGGLPYHTRCGAGVLDPVKWHETLSRMVELKAAPDVTGQEFTQAINVGAPVQTPDADGKGQYVYKIEIPADMTLGKLTFLIPQYFKQHSDITVKAPSGFEVTMPRSLFYAVSSHALAYEDVKAGQFIEIRTDKALAPGAQMTLRGHTGVNAIAKLRDVLRADGTLPAPLTSIGGEPAEYPLPVAPTNAVVGDTIAVPEAITAPVEEEKKDVVAPPVQGNIPLPRPQP
jgi:hypothetical protein